MLQDNPALAGDIIHISRSRMHLIALALAHQSGSITREMCLVLLRGSAGDILDWVLGYRPVGMKRAFQHLPGRALQAESYRQLVQLLHDAEAAKLIHHASKIDDDVIKTIDEIPPGLRSLVFSMQAWFSGIDEIADGLRYLVRCGAAPTFEALVAELAKVRQPEQLVAKLKLIVESLPLPDVLPPSHIAHAKRLDCPADIRALAKRWRNCLADYQWRVDNGDCCLYWWDDSTIQAACLVERHGRFGWFLEDVKGPRNSEIEPGQFEAIRQSYAAAGVPLCSTIKLIEDIYGMAGERRLRRRDLNQNRGHARQEDDPLLSDI
jgi:hypothetical protein